MKTKSVLNAIIGLDLGDARHAVCVLDIKGDIIEENSIGNTRNSLNRLAQQFPGARVALEVGSHSPWISRHLKQLGLEVFVANARKLRAIYQNHRKCDQLDARMLARLARVDPSLLHPIEHGSEQSQRDLLRIKLRDNLVRQRVDVISAVRFSLKSLGVRLPSPNSACFAKRARMLLKETEPDLLAMIESSLEVIDTITQKIRQLDREIEQLCQASYPQTQRLRQIRGVGPLTALCFVLTLETPQRFQKPRDVGAFVGLVPRRDQSGGTDKSLPISKSGNSYLRRLLVGCAQYMLGPFGEECDLRTHGLELIERGGRGARNKAVVATARKLSVLLLTLWRDQSDYQPQRQAA